MWETVNGQCWGIGRGYVPVYRRGGERGLRGFGDWLGRCAGFVRGRESGGIEAFDVPLDR